MESPAEKNEGRGVEKGMWIAPGLRQRGKAKGDETIFKNKRSNSP